MHVLGARVIGALAAVVALGCGKKTEVPPTGAASTAAGAAAPATATAVAPAGGCDQHAVCADHFYIDAPVANCVAGMECTAVITLGATGAFHVNDEYPYKFTAALQPGVQFVGTDPAGQNVFSKGAGYWRKLDEKSGALSVKFFIGTPGEMTITGKFKLSVCSAANCLLEQRDIQTHVLAI
jgi:hypothetical protein